MGLKKGAYSWFPVVVLALSLAIVGNLISARGYYGRAKSVMAEEKPLKWIEFNVTEPAMTQALKLDVDSRDTPTPMNWVDLLAFLGAKYGGNFIRYKSIHLDALAEKIRAGKTMEELTVDMEYYDYYRKAYGAVLDGMVGVYQIQTEQSLLDGTVEMQEKYGLKAYSPIAYGYSFSHYDDFGNSRSFGYSRPHVGNDLLGNIGTPIIAVESGVVETAGWNRYGGWRVGIRSFDGLRYYYYAHLRKDHPYQSTLKEGEIIEAGDIVGYLGMTGYSDKENVNGMKVPHLHFGMQIVPKGTPRECQSEIWINVYEIIKFLEHHKSPVLRDDQTKEYNRKYCFVDPAVEQLNGMIPSFS